MTPLARENKKRMKANNLCRLELTSTLSHFFSTKKSESYSNFKSLQASWSFPSMILSG